MIDVEICRKCGFFMSANDMGGYVSIRCKKEVSTYGLVYETFSKPPARCPFLLEHELANQDLE